MADAPVARSLAAWRTHWQLKADGPERETPSSLLQPVTVAGKFPAFLKIALIEEEARGMAALAWWSAQNEGAGGAVPVLAYEGLDEGLDDGGAMLMARGGDSLETMAQADDASATGILCGVIATLHRQDAPPPDGMRPLQDCFTDLFVAARSDERFAAAADAADVLLAEAGEAVLLHGDIHHGNVLDFGSGGWRAIDAKGLIGPRGFDYANLFCNPTEEMASDPNIFRARVYAVSRLAGIEQEELCRWVLAWAGLSAVWMKEKEDAETRLAVMALAAEVLTEVAP